MLRQLVFLFGLLAAPAVASAQEGTADLIRDHLYSGQLAEGYALMLPLAEAGDAEAKLGQGLFKLFMGFEELSQAFNRHGFNPARSIEPLIVLGIAVDAPAAERTDPEPLDYAQLRGYMEAFSQSLDEARPLLLAASEDTDFAIEIDVWQIRGDINGDGVAGDDETIGGILTMAANMGAPVEFGDNEMELPEARFAFDAADAIWLAGYTQVVALQVEFLLAHDFEEFFLTMGHLFFPGAGLPMDEDQPTGQLFMDPNTDRGLADTIAGIHMLSWTVEDPERLAAVRGRMLEVLDLSRRSWAAILAETDDHLEFIPSPRQTPVNPAMAIDKPMVEAWLETLDVAETIVEGELLLPHWRYPNAGFDLKAFFETAERTDFVMLFTGHDARAFMREGPVANAQSFNAANSVFGDSIWGYAAWFN